MRREFKNALSKQRIIMAALQEFSVKGYENSSLNTLCESHNLSKGIIYHYFSSKDELYLACLNQCFQAFSEYMEKRKEQFTGTLEENLKAYFDGRMSFFLENPVYSGIFLDASFPPGKLSEEITACRKEFEQLSISVLTGFLSQKALKEGLSLPIIVDDFRAYIEYFNLQFAKSFRKKLSDVSAEEVFREHEEKFRRHLSILLYGILEEKDI